MIQLLMLPFSLLATVASAVANAFIWLLGGVIVFGLIIAGVLGLSWWLSRM